MNSELESELRDSVDWSRKWLVKFNAGKTQLISFDQSNKTGATDVTMDGSVLYILRCWGWLFLPNWIGPLTISLAKTASKKIGALICSIKFLSPEVVLYPCKSMMQPCMEYCCHVQAVAHSCYLELIVKLQKQICRTVSPSNAASLEPLAHG